MATESERMYLTRKEAAAYVTKRYFSMSDDTLWRMARDGKGPPCGKNESNRPLYTREDLDNWARKFRPPGAVMAQRPDDRPLAPMGVLASAAR